MIKLKLLVASVLLLGVTNKNVQAQDVLLNWVQQKGTVQHESGYTVSSDASGNVYSSGYFRNTTDFDPGVGTANLTAVGGADAYIQKTDADGNYLWAVQFGSTGDDEGLDVQVDGSGNVYLTGVFRGTVDFDPGAGVQNLTPGGGGDAFLVKLDADGNYLWAISFPGGSGADLGRDLAIDASGNVLVSGFFYGTVDFDPSVNVANVTSTGQADAFVAKYDSNGNYLWAKSIGGSTNDDGHSVVVDGSGNAYWTGYFNGTADLDPGAGVQNFTAVGGDIFLIKLDASGAFVWADQMGSSAADNGLDVQIDSNGDIVMTGIISGTADLDPGVGVQNLVSVGGYDPFVAKYDANGGYLWAVSMGSTQNEEGWNVTLDEEDNIYSVGFFRGTVDFDPGVGTHNITSAGAADAYIQKLDASGNFIWAKSIGGTADEHAMSIKYDITTGALLTSGFFTSVPVDFDPGAGTQNLSSVGGLDIFVLSLKQCFPDATTDVINSCGPITWIDGNTYSSNEYAATHTLTNMGGCDSVVTLHLTVYGIADQTASTTSTTGCDSVNNVTIDLASSENGVTYWLRDDANDTVVDGPFDGTGSALQFNAGTIFQSMDYNVYAEQAIDFGVQLDKTNTDRLSVTAPFGEYGTEITVEAWIYFDGTANDVPWMGQSSLGADNMSTNVWLWHNSGSNGEIEWFVNDNGAWKSVASSSLAGLTGWHHVATVASSTGLEIFVDGVSDAFGSSITTGVVNNTNSVFHFGGDPRFPTDPNRHGSYGLSEVRVWDVARSQSEISSNMNTCLAGNEAGLVYYNKISDNTGTIATANIGTNASFSSGMSAGTAWINGAGTCEQNCTAEMSQIVSVTVNNATSNTVVVDTCASSYTWAQNSQTYTVSGMYNDTITNVAGCDSVVTLDLTMVTLDNSVTNTDPTLTAVMTGAQYQWLDCDDSYAVLTGETSQSFTAAANGNYAVEVSFGGCVDTSACETIATVGFDSYTSEKLVIYPNPTNGEVYIQLPQVDGAFEVNIFSLDGKLVQRDVLNSNNSMIDLSNLNSGIYTIQIINQDKRFISKVRLF
ncbi:T9SS type A sorting domain-containing protein [Paracrocinitomix mangrovi]|uniref:LamG-like jellyroll fold domain-containing protein n=1 Tax=Paracrocinitomix mangrovi TaxID=2862509 RepID=UPI001C8D0679|nr:LamG-like jellyroll fold domain-containing protein [Paracrocinitomix mangrovi]UKN00985.1 T9SS type A sorting domain-containing protein [Paracrocinitomix mangrovi]